MPFEQEIQTLVANLPGGERRGGDSRASGSMERITQKGAHPSVLPQTCGNRGTEAAPPDYGFVMLV